MERQLALLDCGFRIADENQQAHYRLRKLLISADLTDRLSAPREL
jgi:hypothetical protein